MPRTEQPDSNDTCKPQRHETINVGADSLHQPIDVPHAIWGSCRRSCKVLKNTKKVDRYSIKCKLKTIYDIEKDNGDILYKTIKDINDIIDFGCAFMKGFILYSMEKEILNVKIDLDFVRISFNVMCSKESTGGREFNESKKIIIKQLEDYFVIFNEITGIKKKVISNVSYILQQEAEKIYISIVNNIIYHIDKYIWNYIKHNFIDDYTKSKYNREKLKEHHSNMRKIKNDILDKPTVKSSKIIYHEWIDKNLLYLLPSTYTPNNFKSDVLNNTEGYIKCMYYINNYFTDNSIKSYNIFPLKHKIYNNYIKINTSALIDLFYGTKFTFSEGSKLNLLSNAGNVKIQKLVWNSVFNFKNKKGKSIFKRVGFSFNFEIETDGYAVSLNFINNNLLLGKEKKKGNFNIKRNESNDIKTNIKREKLLDFCNKLELDLKTNLNIPLDKDMSDDTKFQSTLKKIYQKQVKDKTFIEKIKKDVNDKYVEIIKSNKQQKKDEEKLKEDGFENQQKEKKKKEKETIKKEKENGTYEEYKLKKDIELNNLEEFPDIGILLKDEAKRDEFLEYYNNGRLVVCDPGKRSIFYMKSCSNIPYTEEYKKLDKLYRQSNNFKQINQKSNNFGVTKWKNDKILNYTSNTRVHFTKRNYHNKLVKKWKNKININNIPSELSFEEKEWYKKTLKDIETEYSFFNSKSSDHIQFLNYVIKRIEYLKKAELQYNVNRLQQLKWYEYLNKNRHERNLIKTIKSTFGDDAIIIMGDWSGKGRLKYRPTPNIALKRTLSHEFPIFDLDEYNTSKIHNEHHVKCDNLYVPIDTYKVKTKNKPNPINVPIKKAHKQLINNLPITIQTKKINVSSTIYTNKSTEDTKGEEKTEKPKKIKNVKSTEIKKVINKPDNVIGIIDKLLTKKDRRNDNFGKLNLITSENKYTETIEQKELQILTISKNPLPETILNNNSVPSENKLKKIHAVLTFKIVKADMACKSLSGCINRDKNAVYSDDSILLSLIRTGTRPSPYTRKPLQELNVKVVNVSDVSSGDDVTGTGHLGNGSIHSKKLKQPKFKQEKLTLNNPLDKNSTKIQSTPKKEIKIKPKIVINSTKKKLKVNKKDICN